MRRNWLPPEMRLAPRLDAQAPAGPPEPKYALLLNPFYPKDPHASFGKHVLTPSLALTSIAAATPREWRVAYWDENLLGGPPPLAPFPQVVGITVHLTFAERAYALAAWYRQRGAQVVLGGLHVISCPQEAAPHADALALGEGVQVWGQILTDAAHGKLKKVYRGDYRRPYRDDPPPRRDLLPRQSFLTTTSLIATRGCHNRCEFCYLSTQGLHMLAYLRAGVPNETARAIIAASGVDARLLSETRADPRGREAFILGFAGHGLGDLQDAAERLGQAACELAGGG